MFSFLLLRSIIGFSCFRHCVENGRILWPALFSCTFGFWFRVNPIPAFPCEGKGKMMEAGFDPIPAFPCEGKGKMMEAGL